MGRLTGKAAVITGSGRGIGRGIALRFAAEGASVLVNDLDNMAGADEVVRTIEQAGGTAAACAADASDADAVQRLVDTAIERFGRLDIAVANAVYERHNPFLEAEFLDARRTTEVLLYGAYHLAQRAARSMVSRGGGGKILFISSIHAVQSFPNAAAYNMAKAGVNHLMRSIAGELAPHRINVNSIEPGWIDTPGERRFYSDDAMREAGSKMPWGRLGVPDDIARAALYLCSDDADYVTGSALRVDGGYTASLSLRLDP